MEPMLLEFLGLDNKYIIIAAIILLIIAAYFKPR